MMGFVDVSEQESKYVAIILDCIFPFPRDILWVVLPYLRRPGLKPPEALGAGHSAS